MQKYAIIAAIFTAAFISCKKADQQASGTKSPTIYELEADIEMDRYMQQCDADIYLVKQAGPSGQFYERKGLNLKRKFQIEAGHILILRQVTVSLPLPGGQSTNAMQEVALVTKDSGIFSQEITADTSAETIAASNSLVNNLFSDDTIVGYVPKTFVIKTMRQNPKCLFIGERASAETADSSGSQGAAARGAESAALPQPAAMPRSASCNPPQGSWPFRCCFTNEIPTDEERWSFYIDSAVPFRDNLLYRLTNKCFRLEEGEETSNGSSIQAFTGSPTGINSTGGMPTNLQALLSAVNARVSDELRILSSYRDYATQRSVFSNWVAQLGEIEAKKVSAVAGHSEHQTGFAIDFTTASLGNSPWGMAFFHTQAYQVMNEIAHTYGFVLSYPVGKEHITCYSAEPWHWRYVGRELAMLLKTQGMAFEDRARIQPKAQYDCPGSPPPPAPPASVTEFNCPSTWDSNLVTCISGDLLGFCQQTGTCAPGACLGGKVYECSPCAVGSSGNHDQCTLANGGGMLHDHLPGTGTPPGGATAGGDSSTDEPDPLHPDCASFDIDENWTTCLKQVAGEFSICQGAESCLAMACYQNNLKICQSPCAPGDLGTHDACF